jgi:hypothetical protein
LAEAVLRPVTGFASRADFTEERPLGGLGRWGKDEVSVLF